MSVAPRSKGASVFGESADAVGERVEKVVEPPRRRRACKRKSLDRRSTHAVGVGVKPRNSTSRWRKWLPREFAS